LQTRLVHIRTANCTLVIVLPHIEGCITTVTGVSLDAVRRRVGVGRSKPYRWWQARYVLLRENGMSVRAAGQGPGCRGLRWSSGGSSTTLALSPPRATFRQNHITAIETFIDGWNAANPSPGPTPPNKSSVRPGTVKLLQAPDTRWSSLRRPRKNPNTMPSTPKVRCMRLSRTVSYSLGSSPNMSGTKIPSTPTNR